MAEKQISPPSLGALDARYLLVANNLSDLANVVTARTNLDIYSKEEARAEAIKWSVLLG